mgnify:FL=1
MNTQIKGQQGYKKSEIFDKMTEAEKLYSQYKWIIKWEIKCPQETQDKVKILQIDNLSYLSD